MDYLPKEDIVYWLGSLEKESKIKDFVLSESQIEYIWEHFGGSIWEICSLLGDFLRVCRDGQVPEDKMREIVERDMVQARSYFKEYAGLDTSKAELLIEIHTHIQVKGVVEESDLKRLLDESHYENRQAVQEELNNLVRNNFLYYNPTLAQYKLQGRSMEIGLKRYVPEVSREG